MIDIEEFHNRPDSMELSVFQNLCMRHIEAAKEKLIKKSVVQLKLNIIQLFHTGLPRSKPNEDQCR